MRVRRIFTIIGLLICIVGFSAVALANQGPQSYSWSTTSPNVASVTWTNQQIATFLDTVTNSSVPSSVADFTFVDLNADGQLDLLAAVDYSGRQIFNTIVVVQRQANNFTVQQIEALNVQSLQGIVADLNNDGHLELLVPTAITPYLGVEAPQAYWTAIYGWNNSLWVDVSSQFSTYYKTTVLPALQQTLNNLQTTSAGTIQSDVAQIEYDKASRVSGQDPTAGLAQALSWASSGDSTHRIFAATVLADIGTPAALDVLNTLVADQDPNVVIYAKAEKQLGADHNATPVQIDIRPSNGSPTPINLSCKGKIPVVILSSPTFNALTSVNVKTLTFGSAGAEDSLVFCYADEKDWDKHRDADWGHEKGHAPSNLVCYFDSQASAFQLDDASATLKGKLKDGTSIKGTAAIIVINDPQKCCDEDYHHSSWKNERDCEHK